MRGYEYVVVGAGTAGCVLAARLSEDGVRVLLLEAGGARALESMAMPPAWPTLMGSSADWADRTVPQQVTGTCVSWPRGRGLGGSSSINAMNFVRGHRASYDAWVTAGAKGWGYDDLLPAFKRSEHTEDRDPAVRGVGGPLMPGPAVRRHPIAEAGLEAAEQAGYPMARDISSGLEEGFGWCDLSIVDGRRQSAADAYLAPILSRPNVDVVTDTLVHQVLMDGDRCRAVEYHVGAETFVAECTGEVVLAAGAVGTPQLLMLSGIGPADHLEDNGIEVVADLPGVGANLHDHPMCGVVYQSAQPVPHGDNNHGEVQPCQRRISASEGRISGGGVSGPQRPGPAAVFPGSRGWPRGRRGPACRRSRADARESTYGPGTDRGRAGPCPGRCSPRSSNASRQPRSTPESGCDRGRGRGRTRSRWGR